MTNVHIKLIVAVMFSLWVGGTVREIKAEEHAHEFAADVNDFHAVLAPLWHATPGRQRTRNVCAQAEELNNLAGKIQSRDSKVLQSSIAELRKECQTASPEIDEVFSQVHHAFHNLVEHPER